LFTDGSKAVRIYVQGSEILLDVPEVSVVDTVGAGDSFSGGFLTYWVQQDWTRADCSDAAKVEAAARFGIQVAGLTCQKSGAQPPFAHEL
jgi:fructokinase